MKLFFSPISTYSQKVLVACFEKNVDFTPEHVNLFDPVERAAYRKLYPLGKVPLLQLDNGRLIPESSIIIEYLETHVDAGPTLIPFDVDLARRARFHDRQFDLYVTEPVGRLFGERMKPMAQRDQKRIDEAKETLDIMYTRLNEVLSTRTWCIGTTFTMADCAAGPSLWSGRLLHPWGPEHKHLDAYFNRLSERPSFARVRKDAEPMVKAFVEQFPA